MNRLANHLIFIVSTQLSCRQLCCWYMRGLTSHVMSCLEFNDVIFTDGQDGTIEFSMRGVVKVLHVPQQHLQPLIRVHRAVKAARLKGALMCSHCKTMEVSISAKFRHLIFTGLLASHSVCRCPTQGQTLLLCTCRCSEILNG